MFRATHTHATSHTRAPANIYIPTERNSQLVSDRPPPPFLLQMIHRVYITVLSCHRADRQTNQPNDRQHSTLTLNVFSYNTFPVPHSTQTHTHTRAHTDARPATNKATHNQPPPLNLPNHPTYRPTENLRQWHRYPASKHFATRERRRRRRRRRHQR